MGNGSKDAAALLRQTERYRRLSGESSDLRLLPRFIEIARLLDQAAALALDDATEDNAQPNEFEVSADAYPGRLIARCSSALEAYGKSRQFTGEGKSHVRIKAPHGELFEVQEFYRVFLSSPRSHHGNKRSDREVAAASDGGRSLTAIGGFLLSLWSANGATKALIAGISVA